MFLGFAEDDVLEEGGELGVGAAGAQHAAEVELEVASEAGAKLAVGGEAELVAVLAEVEVRHRADEADLLAGGGDAVIDGGAVGAEVGGFDERAGGLLDEFFGGGDGEEGVLAEHVLGADGHELDEAEEGVFAAGVVHEGGELALGLAFDEDAVELDGFEAGGDGGVDAFEDAGEEVAAGGALIDGTVQGIERDVGGADAGFDEVLRDGDAAVELGEEGAVGGDADFVDAGDAGEVGAKGGDAGAGEGLAAGDAELFDAEGGADADDAEELVVAEGFVLGEPGLLLLGHAVAAAFVAPVGDGDAKVGDAMAEGVLHREG